MVHITRALRERREKMTVDEFNALDRRINRLVIAAANEPFLEALAERGAEVRRVPVYRWALPEDTAPLRDAVERIGRGEADIILFTNSTQVDHLIHTLSGMGAVIAKSLEPAKAA